MEPTTCNVTCTSARSGSPAVNNSIDSNENVENVVKPPKSPVIQKSFSALDADGCEANHAANSPMARPPIRLHVKVPNGNTPQRALSHVESAQRKQAPSAPPAPTLAIAKGNDTTATAINDSNDRAPRRRFLERRPNVPDRRRSFPSSRKALRS